MANKQLPDFLTAENELDGNEPVYIAQSGKTRKTLLSKIKDFIIGTTSMGTTATDVTGAVKELNDKIGSEEKEGSIIASLKEKANKSNAEFTGYIKLNDNYVPDGEIKNITLLNGWTLVDGSIEFMRVGKVGIINLSLKSGVINPSGSTQVLELPFYSRHTILFLTGYGEINNINITVSGNQVHVWGISSAIERLPINIAIPLV